MGIKHANLVDDAVQSKGQQPNAVHAKVQVDYDEEEEIVVNSSRTRKRVKYAVSDEEEWDEHTAPAETRMVRIYLSTTRFTTHLTTDIELFPSLTAVRTKRAPFLIQIQTTTTVL